MKKRSFLNKLLFWCNSLVAFLLVLSFVLPYIPPKSFPTLSLLSLLVSPLIQLNLLFAVFWLIKFKKTVFVSAIPLLIAYFFFNPFIQNNDEIAADTLHSSKQLKILSYNVRLFNAYEADDKKRVETFYLQKIITEDAPDIICIQEYYKDHTIDFSTYPYQFIHFKEKPWTKIGELQNLGHAIFSKYPLLNKGSFDFKETYNNTIYTDVVVAEDTLRLYNVHLQSMGVLASVSQLQEADATMITNKMSSRFVKQQYHVETIKAHQQASPYPTILAGDFNNTAYSYSYHFMMDHMQDAFIEKGNGLGTTFSFDGYPMRIDFIMAQQGLQVVTFKTLAKSFSDHYPILATISVPFTVAK